MSGQRTGRRERVRSPGLDDRRAGVDLRLHGRSGLEVVKELAELDPATLIVVLTGYGSIATALEAVRKGAAD